MNFNDGFYTIEDTAPPQSFNQHQSTGPATLTYDEFFTRLKSAHYPYHSIGLSKHCCLGEEPHRPVTRRHPNDTPNLQEHETHESPPKVQEFIQTSREYAHFSEFYEIPTEITTDAVQTIVGVDSIHTKKTKKTKRRLRREECAKNNEECKGCSRTTSPIYSTDNPPRTGDTLTSSPSEHEYLQFALRITEDILKNDLYANSEIKRVFNSHTEANRGRLDEERMRKQIKELALELKLSYDDIISPRFDSECGKPEQTLCECYPWPSTDHYICALHIPEATEWPASSSKGSDVEATSCSNMKQYNGYHRRRGKNIPDSTRQVVMHIKSHLNADASATLNSKEMVEVPAKTIQRSSLDVSSRKNSSEDANWSSDLHPKHRGDFTRSHKDSQCDTNECPKAENVFKRDESIQMTSHTSDFTHDSNSKIIHPEKVKHKSVDKVTNGASGEEQSKSERLHESKSNMHKSSKKRSSKRASQIKTKPLDIFLETSKQQIETYKQLASDDHYPVEKMSQTSPKPSTIPNTKQSTQTPRQSTRCKQSMTSPKSSFTASKSSALASKSSLASKSKISSNVDEATKVELESKAPCCDTGSDAFDTATSIEEPQISSKPSEVFAVSSEAHYPESAELKNTLDITNRHGKKHHKGHHKTHRNGNSERNHSEQRREKRRPKSHADNKTQERRHHRRRRSKSSVRSDKGAPDIETKSLNSSGSNMSPRQKKSDRITPFDEGRATQSKAEEQSQCCLTGIDNKSFRSMQSMTGESSRYFPMGIATNIGSGTEENPFLFLKPCPHEDNMPYSFGTCFCKPPSPVHAASPPSFNHTENGYFILPGPVYVAQQAFGSLSPPVVPYNPPGLKTINVVPAMEQKANEPDTNINSVVQPEEKDKGIQTKQRKTVCLCPSRTLSKCDQKTCFSFRNKPRDDLLLSEEYDNEIPPSVTQFFPTAATQTTSSEFIMINKILSSYVQNENKTEKQINSIPLDASSMREIPYIAEKKSEKKKKRTNMESSLKDSAKELQALLSTKALEHLSKMSTHVENTSDMEEEAKDDLDRIISLHSSTKLTCQIEMQKKNRDLEDPPEEDENEGNLNLQENVTNQPDVVVGPENANDESFDVRKLNSSPYPAQSVGTDREDTLIGNPSIDLEENISDDLGIRRVTTSKGSIPKVMHIDKPDDDDFMKKLDSVPTMSMTTSMEKRIKKVVHESEMFRHPEEKTAGWASNIGGIDLADNLSVESSEEDEEQGWRLEDTEESRGFHSKYSINETPKMKKLEETTTVGAADSDSTTAALEHG
ncbi:hypothetical protein Trydic_g2104 [Trypoxylus dichotomus]